MSCVRRSRQGVTWARVLTVVLAAAIGFGCSVCAARAELVYFSISDPWEDLAAQPAQWTFVQKHADGFYFNFLMMDRAFRNTHGVSAATVTQMCGLMATHSAYYESDIRPGVGPTPEREQQYIDMLHQGGCKLLFTSFNYGWTAARAQNLTQFALTPDEGKRLSFVQLGPWLLNGDISGPSLKSRPGYNEQLRQEILAADGLSTDGPLGYWAADFGHYHSASLSLVRFAHQNGKKALLEISPYGGGEAVYDAPRDLLAEAEAMVRFHESQRAIPDIWIVSQYNSRNVPPLPEQLDGKPAVTMSGVAYWLLHHIHDPNRWAHLELAPPAGASVGALQIDLVNDSTWLDLAPLLRLSVRGAGADVRVALTLDGRDVTAEAAGPAGLALTDILELMPGSKRRLAIEVTKSGAPVSVSGTLTAIEKSASQQPGIELSFAPNPGVANEIHQRLFISLPPGS